MSTAKVKVIAKQTKSGMVFKLRWRANGKDKQRSAEGATTRRQAERMAAKLEQEIDAGRTFARCAWETFRQRYIRDHLSGLSDRYGSTWGAAANNLEEYCDPQYLGGITAETLAGFAGWLRKRDRSENTIKAYLKHLIASLRWAHDLGLLDTVPKVRLPGRAKLDGATEMRGRPITMEEYERIRDQGVESVITQPVDHLRWRTYLDGLYFGGLRLSESLLVSWDWDAELSLRYDASHRLCLCIQHGADKKGTARMHGLAPKYRRLLELTPADQRRGRVYRMGGTADHVGRKVSAMGAAAGVITGADRQTATAHDLRRAFGVYWSRQPGITVFALKDIMRHADIRTTEKYYLGRSAAEDIADLMDTAELRASETLQAIVR